MHCLECRNLRTECGYDVLTRLLIFCTRLFYYLIRNLYFETTIFFSLYGKSMFNIFITARSEGRLNKFAYIFDQSGNFVFSSSENPDDTVIVHVALEGTSCGNFYRIQPQSELSLRSLGVSPTTKLNLTPDWIIILSVMFSIIIF